MDRLKAFTRNVRTSTTVILLICIIVTVALFVVAFITPPPGEIHQSILRAATILFAFASLAVLREAIREGYAAKLTHGNTTLEIKDADGHPEKKPEHRPEKQEKEDML